MGRLVPLAVAMLAAALGGPARADVLIGVAGPITGTCLVRRADGARHGTGRGRPQRQGRRARQQVQLITADDYCDPEQAVAAAKKLVSDGVIFVVGHYCSGGLDPGIRSLRGGGSPDVTPSSSNPMLTELGRANVFRVQNRDDAVGIAVGDYLADHWADKNIAILHDNTAFGKYIAEEAKKQLNRRGLTEAIYQAYVPGKTTMEPKSISSRRLMSPWRSLADTTPRSGSWHVWHATAATRFSW